MRILQFTDHHHQNAGGAEKICFELKERLQHIPGLELYSLGFGAKKSEGSDFVILKGATHPFTKFLSRIFFNPFVYWQLRKQIKKWQPDIIHLHNIKQYPFSILAAIKSYRVVHTMHDFTFICPTGQNIHQNTQTPCETGIRRSCFWQHHTKYPLLVFLLLTFSYRRIKKKLQHLVKYTIAPSPLLTDYLKRNGWEATETILPFMQQINPLSFQKCNPNHFLFIGHLGKHKGVMLLLEEFAIAVQSCNQLTLHIVGTGPALPAMQSKIEQLNLEKNIIFHGFQHQLTPFYEQCNALIFPSTGLESFGLVMTEAMSHSRAVIGIARGTVPWLVNDQQTGLLFNPLKKGDLAQKILQLANHPKKAQALGENAYRKMQNWMSNEEILQKTLAIYKNLNQ